VAFLKTMSLEQKKSLTSINTVSVLLAIHALQRGKKLSNIDEKQ
jgi:hypothetical protein